MAKVVLVLHKKRCFDPGVESAVEEVRKRGIGIEIHIPWSKEDLGEFVQRTIAEGTERIVAGGGDGTLNVVVSAMMEFDEKPKASLGILPLGTANDFAKAVGLGATNLANALELASTGKPTKIDVGKMNDKYFINVASAGIGAEATATTSEEMKAAFGGAAYYIMGFVRAFQFESYEGRLTLPDGFVDEGPILVMAVGNGRFAGGGYEVAPRASLTDGLLDLSIVHGARPFRLSEDLKEPSMQDDRQLYRQVSTFKFETEKPVRLNLDGEPEAGTHFAFRCCPKALSVVLGDSA